MRSYDEPILASGAGVCRLRWPEGAVERDARHSAGAGHGSDWPERRRQDDACQRPDRLSAADQRPRDARWCRDQRDERPSGSTARGRPDFPVRAGVSRSLGPRQSCGDRGRRPIPDSIQRSGSPRLYGHAGRRRGRGRTGGDPLTLLTLDKVSVRYGQLRALREVSFDLAKGETLYVTGPNGAGKSTLLKAIAGVVAATGEIGFEGKTITSSAPEDIARLGISMVPEGRGIFGSLTIEENLRLGTGIRTDKAAIAEDLADIYAVFPVLKERRNSSAGVLSGGQQQMLAIARALMTRPRLLAIDEPSLGLAPKIIDQVYETLLKLRDQRGLTLLIVEQSSTRALLSGGRMILMRSGEIILQGDARVLASDHSLTKAYFGYEET